jgi:hypothetical protein
MTSRKAHPEWVLDLYNLVLAAILFLHPWMVARANGTASIDAWVSGAALAAVSLAALVAFVDWEEWVNLALGIWLVASPWVLGFTHTSAMHFSIGIGAAVAFLALLEIWLRYDAAHPELAPSALPRER